MKKAANMTKVDKIVDQLPHLPQSRAEDATATTEEHIASLESRHREVRSLDGTRRRALPFVCLTSCDEKRECEVKEGHPEHHILHRYIQLQ